MRPQDVVAAGYDAMAGRFGQWRATIEGSPDDEWLDDLLARPPEGSLFLARLDDRDHLDVPRSAELLSPDVDAGALLAT